MSDPHAMIPEAHGAMALVVALAIGLFSSLTHCAGMCAPIHFFLAARRGSAVYAYHAGRILTYALLGGAAGFLGQGLLTAPSAMTTRVTATALAAVYALMALHWFGVLPWATWMEKAVRPFSAFVSRPIGRLFAQFGGAAPVSQAATPAQSGFGVSARLFGAGLAGGLLPCPTTQAGLLIAVGMGYPAAGALTMAAMGLGTLPVFVALRPNWVRGPKRFAKAYALALGFVFIALAAVKVHGAWFVAAPRCH